MLGSKGCHDLGRQGLYHTGKNGFITPTPLCKLRMHHCTSVVGAKQFGDHSVDAVFIDGLHTHEGVLEDVEA